MDVFAFVIRIIISGILTMVTIGTLPEEVSRSMLEYPGMIMGISYLFTGGYYFTLGLVFND